MTSFYGIEYPIGSGTIKRLDLTTDYRGLFLFSEARGVAVTPDSQALRDAAPWFRSVTFDPAATAFSLFRKPDGALARLDFHANLNTWLNPHVGARGLRYLYALADDGATLVRMPVQITSLSRRPNAYDAYDVIASGAVPWWEAVTASGPLTLTTASPSGTATNNGTQRVAGVLTLSGAASLSGTQVTVTDTGGRGLTGVLVDVGSTAFPLGTLLAIGGVEQSFHITGTSPAHLWLPVNVAPGGAQVVDFITLSGFTNPDAGSLDTGTIVAIATSSVIWNGFSQDLKPDRGPA